MNKISNILQDATKDLLTEDTLQEIETAFENAVNEKVQLYVEKALLEQDEEYATKLESLLEAIDVEHARKFKLTMESMDKDYSQKLVKVVRKYERELSRNAKLVKENLEKNISDYLEIYLEDKVPQATIEESVELKRSQKLLNDVRQVLGVNSAVIKESIREAILDGKQQIDALAAQTKKQSKQLQTLQEQLQQTKTRLLLEQRTKGFDERKRQFIFDSLKDKNPNVIEENFDYIVNMFNKKEKERLNDLKSDARKRSNVEKSLNEEHPIRRKVVNESRKADTNNYTARYMEGVK